MKTYIGTKLIRALPMTRAAYNEFRGWQLPADENGGDAGYLVEYLDGGKPNTPQYMGYVSWSPAEQFDKAYRPTVALTFGMALEALKLGKKVARAGWNGVGLTLRLVGIGNLTLSEDEISTLPYIVICYPPDAKTTPNAVVPWLASQTDMLADDWQVVP